MKSCEDSWYDALGTEQYRTWRVDLTEEIKIYTVGYEGRAVEGFLRYLSEVGVEVLVDVRELPVSRKPGFSKAKLARYASEEGIDYLHLRSLGSPRNSRKKLKEGGDFATFSEEYVAHLEDSNEDLEALLALINSGKHAALMCFERDHTVCHRTLLVSKLLGQIGENLPIYHL